MKDEKKVATVRVAEAMPRDVGRGIARLDKKIMDELKINPGDVIELEGSSRTVAIAWPGYPEDYGTGIVRIDGFIRRNAGVSLDDAINIRKVNAKNAERIILAPTEPLRLMGAEDYIKGMLLGRAVTRGDTIPVSIMGRRLNLVVVNVFPVADAVIINQDTNISISERPAAELKAIPKVTYEDIGGLKDVIQKIREMVELPMRHPEIFRRLGVEPPKGVLLYGPPGTGKTLLAKAVANESGANFISVKGP
ncbi:MAG: AAA family ATPase, partial [Thermoproteota archaeon]